MASALGNNETQSHILASVGIAHAFGGILTTASAHLATLAVAPAHLPTLWLALLGAFALGIVHGITPDEHTWPITVSYAVGSTSARKVLRSAIFFSLAFALQCAVLSELAYLGLVVVREDVVWNAGVYVVVGVFMVAAAVYMLRLKLRYTLHLHLWPPRIAVCGHDHGDGHHHPAPRAPSPAMAAVHGFVAGFGIDAFGVIVATVLAPSMPSAALGWAPGALFGLGTMVVLAGVGAVIGMLVRRRRLSEQRAQRVAQHAAGRTLLLGGAMFFLAGVAGLLDPTVMSAGIATGVHVHNLEKLDVGMALLLGVVLVAGVTMARAARMLRGEPAMTAAAARSPGVAVPAPGAAEAVPAVVGEAAVGDAAGVA